MKQKIKKIIIIIIFFIGLLVFIYPTASKIINNYLIQITISNYKEYISNATVVDKSENQSSDIKEDKDDIYIKENLDGLLDNMQVYNENIFNEGQQNLLDPFSYELPSFDLLEIGFKENVIGYLTIPKMDIEVPIYLGATQENMKKGATHLSETSIPIGGINTNSVISAHRGMKTHPMFRDIEMLEIGDEVKITNMWDELIYKVIETKVITPDQVSEVLIQEGRDLITLITCHPYTQNYQRYVVYCERQDENINYEESEVLNNNIDNKKIYNIINIEKDIRNIGVIFIIIFGGYICYRVIRKKKS